MKKALLYSLSLALILSLTACNNQGDTSGIAGDMENDGSVSSEQAGTTSSGPSETRGTGDNVDVQTGDISTGIVVSGTQAEQTGEKVNGETGEQTGEQAGEGEKAPEKVEPFTEVNETVYATGTVNLRSSYSTQSDKVGGLNKGQSATRIGVGTGEADGWSKIQLSDGSIVYVSSKYLSTTKPASSGNGGGNGGTTSKPTQSKPSTPSSEESSSSGGQSIEDIKAQKEKEMEKNLEGGTKVDMSKTDEEGNPIGGKV